MSRWFRYYDDALNDPKVQALPPALFKFWVNLLCVASRNGGAIPPLDELKTALKARLDHVETHLKDLLSRGLVDEIDGRMEPHNWRKRQYKSDNSTDRVKAHRNAKRNVSETPPDTETDTDIDDDGARALVTAKANKLSDEIATACGHDPSFIPPNWFGAPYRAQQWLNQGWPEEIILLSVREQIAKKRDGPPSRIEYFEKGIAAAIARQNAPLPPAQEQPRQQNGNTKANSGLAAIDRIFDQLESRPCVPSVTDENAVLRLPARPIPRS